MTAIGASEWDVEEFLKKKDSTAQEEYLKPGHLKVHLFGQTYAFPADENKDPKWTVQGLKERTFDEFRQLLIEFFKQKSVELSKDDEHAKDFPLVSGNLTINDVGLKLHGDPIHDRNKAGKEFKIGETKYIGDVLYVVINAKNRGDIVVPSWITYCTKNEKQIRKNKIKQWNANAKKYNEQALDKSAQISREEIKALKNKEDWSMKFILDNSHKAEIDEINAQRAEMTGANENKENKEDNLKLEYLELSDKMLNGYVMSNDTTVGQLREMMFNELMKNDKNRKNIARIGNENVNKDMITLKHKFSVWVQHSDATEIKHVGRVRNGDTIKIGIKVPLWYKVVHRLKLVNFKDLNEKNPNTKQAKTDINSIIAMIKDETNKY